MERPVWPGYIGLRSSFFYTGFTRAITGRNLSMRIQRRPLPWSAIACWAAAASNAKAATEEGSTLQEALVREAERPGKSAWKPMLIYLAELHGRSVHPPLAHLPHPFEDIGPGYQ